MPEFSQLQVYLSFIHTRWFRFLSVGGIATLCQYILLVVFVEWFSWQKVFSSAFAYTLAAGVNYLLNYYITFASKKKHSQTVIKFIVTAGLGLILNTVLFQFLLYMSFYYMAAQVVATLGTLIFNFCLHKFWIYRPE